MGRTVHSGKSDDADVIVVGAGLAQHGGKRAAALNGADVQAVAEIAGLADYLRGRLPGPDVTPEQLRSRSWWTGAEVYVIVDDYELVATSSGNPLAPLAEFLPFARDIGLRVIVARSAGGAGRSMYEPVMQRMRELGGQGVILSGNRDEGALLGTVKPQALPPGRGIYVSRRATNGQMVQTGWLPVQ